MRASHFLPALNGGELSPLLMARVDLAKHAAACQRLENFLPLIEGPVTRRPGSRNLGPAQSQQQRSWLVPFVFGRRDAWLLEFSGGALRFWVGDGRVLAANQVVYGIGTPYAVSDLERPDGTFALSFAQARDRLWIAGGNQPPQLLQRFGPTNWTLKPFAPDDGPWERENLDEAARAYVVFSIPGLFGSVVATQNEVGQSARLFGPGAGASPFAADDVGRLVRLFVNPSAGDRPWEAGASITAGGVRTSNGRWYEALNSGTTGGIRPVHATGTAFDRATGGVEWRYLHSGYGVGRIARRYSSGAVRIVLLTRMPPGAVGSANATERWQLSAWPEGEWPTAVGFAFERLVFARGNRLWFSRTDDFFSFNDRSEGTLVADDALTLTLSGSAVTEVHWLEETAAGLVVGTDGGEFLVTKANTAEVFGSVTDATRNAQVTRHTSYGSRRVPPALAHGRLIMVDATGRKLREMERRIETDRLQGIDLTAMAAHILAPGVVWQAWQGHPDNVLWLGLDDGSLVSCTYLPEQEIVAFARHRIGSGGDEPAHVEHGAAIPSVDGGSTELWLVVRRILGGTVRRSIERLFPRWVGGVGATAAASRHLDGALVYRGEPREFVEMPGLAGLTLPALADGFDLPALTFDGNGAAALPFAASEVVVGFPYSSAVELLVPNAGGMDGPGIGKLRRTRELVLTLIDSGDQFLAGALDRLRRVDQRPASLPAGVLVPLVTGDVRLPVELGWARRPLLGVRVDGPLPFTLAAVLQRLDLSE